ncbi:MAG TPA: (deoxy)nucleoside triphosphate pyrophosphohydrolase [Candidatus Sulfotelmatobacter sp.]|nr:(deoxy)nucleoside triphosphate pyrophosphohydrolase [Candidatus Sulfotelmatobacter sp.]
MNAPGSVVRHVRVAAAVVWREGHLLLTQRPPGGPLGLHWEFPGGKIEPGETVEQALLREIREELGVGATIDEVLQQHEHHYDHGLSVELWFVRCKLDGYEFVRSPEVHAIRWVKPADIDLGGVLAADRDFLRSLGARG